MRSKHSFRAAWVALFGFVALLVTNAANAVIDLDDDSGAVVFAMETLTVDGAVEKDGKTYYIVNGGSDSLDVTAKAGVGVASSGTLGVTYDFKGMVLSGKTSLALSDGGKSKGVPEILKGGASGDKSVRFLVTPDGTISATTTLTLKFGNQIAISPNMPVSIKMTVTTGATGPFGSDENVASYSSAVSVKSAITETATANVPVASVADQFYLFKPSGNASESVSGASVGTFMVAANTSYLNAKNGDPIKDIGDVAEIKDIENSSVVFSGDFSFAKYAGLGTETDGSCAAAMPNSGDLLEREEDVVDMKLKAVALDQFKQIKALCIYVGGPTDEMAVEIPKTDPYMAKTMYTSPTTNPLYPTSSNTSALGQIDRDGTTVRIGYLTTFPDYNQRIVIVNRGGKVPYSLQFRTESEVTATPGPAAEGMLPAGAVTYLSLQYPTGNVVAIDGSYRVAATLLVTTEPRNIDVLVSQTNMNGGTDTVRYPAE